MDAGGATERALHAQIGRQQKRLIEQVAKDASEAAAKLSAGEVFAFTIMSVAMMKALEDGME